tara:strand:- start:1612 stop:2094 length:483 start_codon:yes stop_codon:yes gene_type:complete
MKIFSLYFMAYGQGKFFGNMLAMDNIKWFERVCVLPKDLKNWIPYEIDDRDPTVPYTVRHELPHINPIQILPNVETVKILQQVKDNSKRSWEVFYSRDVKNWRAIDTAIYTLSQDDLSNWTKTKQHIKNCAKIYNLNVNYNLAKEYFDVYWQAHSTLFTK